MQNFSKQQLDAAYKLGISNQIYINFKGLKIPEDLELQYLIDEYLNSPLPEGWTVNQESFGVYSHSYYHNRLTGECSWDNPNIIEF